MAPKKYFGFFGKTRKLKGAGAAAGSDIKEDDSKSATNGKESFWGNTEYGIGWLPLGGYCKISGMIDESMDTEQLKKPAQKWEFRAKLKHGSDCRS